MLLKIVMALALILLITIDTNAVDPLDVLPPPETVTPKIHQPIIPPSAGKITQLKSAKEVLIKWSEPTSTIQNEDNLVVYSKDTTEVVGYLTVKNVATQNSTHLISAELTTHSQSQFIRPGDTVRLVDFTTAPAETHAGRNELLNRRTKNISSRYRPLFYQGLLSGETAATLAQDEILINPSLKTNWGISKNVTLAFKPLAWIFAQDANASIKYNLFESEWARFSVGADADWFFKNQKSNYDYFTFNFTFYFDFPSNSKLTSHGLITLSAAPGRSTNNAPWLSQVLGLSDSKIQTGYSYILDNWDRVIFGPMYNFAEGGQLGAYIGYMFIWDHFHLVVEVTVRNFAYLNLDLAKGYAPSVTGFWRF